MFPLASLAVLAGLIYSDQGRDVLRVLVSAAAPTRGDAAISGLLFLLGACAALSFSVWYSSRWLLTAQMVALPLPPAGFWQTWLPRLLGFSAPGMIGVGLMALRYRKPALPDDEIGTAFGWAIGFLALGALLLFLYAERGKLMDRLGLGTGTGRRRATTGANRPGHIDVDEATPQATRCVMVWSVATTLAIGGLFVLFPITLPRTVGAAAIASLALASINLFGSFVLTYFPLRHALPPLWIWVILCAGLLLSRCNDNHVVRAAPDTALHGSSPMDPVQAYAQALPADGVVIFVASEGGGIRAAYWTAAVLDQIDAADPSLDLKHRIAVLSGVSGGSLGVAAWLASHRHEYCPDSAAGPGRAMGVLGATPPAMAASTALSGDFVAPAVAGMFYGDLMQRFLPHAFATLDRSRAIEGAWQLAFAYVPGQPFERTLDSFYAGCPKLPQLLLNATRVETGERVVLTRLPTHREESDRWSFVNTFDGMQDGSMTRLQSLAGLVHHSARFPFVSPPGTIEIAGTHKDAPPSFRLVDGGYFDNSGVQSAVDAIEMLRGRLAPLTFHPLLLLIRNSDEPLDHQKPDDDGVSAVFPETGSIGLALAMVRGSHAVTIRADAERRFQADLIDVPVRAADAVAPLGWALSASSRHALDEGAAIAARDAARQIADRLAAAGKQ
ncbi:MAG: hypothetical protein JSR59_23195 [Proteobacteria bacterium]|nr:hypothetical protein [Pseudomonadota bacterium]